jgi:Peptidase A4 family
MLVMPKITLRFRSLLSLAAMAAILVQLGATGSAFASSGGPGAGGARGASGSAVRQMREPDANSSTFAGYSLQGGGEGTWTVTANVVVPKLACTSGPERAIAPSVGVYNLSDSFSAANLFVGCYQGKAFYFPSLRINGANHNYTTLKAAAGDKVVLHVSQSASRTVVSVADKSRKGVEKTLKGAGSKGGSAPWVGDTGWDNPGLLGVPNFGTTHFSGATLDGQPFAGPGVARWNRVKGKTTQITTSTFVSSNESFTTVFKHS